MHQEAVKEDACRLSLSATLFPWAALWQGKRDCLSLHTTPYGSIRSTTGVGVDAKLVPMTSIYRTLGRTSRSSACTYTRSNVATCPLMVVWTLGVHVAVVGS